MPSKPLSSAQWINNQGGKGSGSWIGKAKNWFGKAFGGGPKVDSTVRLAMDEDIPSQNGRHRKSGSERMIPRSSLGPRSSIGMRTSTGYRTSVADGDKSGRGGGHRSTASKGFGFGSAYTPAPPPGVPTNAGGRPVAGGKQRRGSFLTPEQIFSTDAEEANLKTGQQPHLPTTSDPNPHHDEDGEPW